MKLSQNRKNGPKNLSEGILNIHDDLRKRSERPMKTDSDLRQRAETPVKIHSDHCKRSAATPKTWAAQRHRPGRVENSPAFQVIIYNHLLLGQFIEPFHQLYTVHQFKTIGHKGCKVWIGGDAWGKIRCRCDNSFRCLLITMKHSC